VPPLFDQLLGAWELLSYRLEFDTGRIVHPLGEEPIGLIVYTPQGRVSVNIMRAGRPPWASPNPAAATEPEMAQAAAGYIAYAGSFTVDEPASVVEHHVDVSLFPNWTGGVQRRFADLSGDELVLAAPLVSKDTGTTLTARLRWRRVP
jgi:hypothetical protein